MAWFSALAFAWPLLLLIGLVWVYQEWGRKMPDTSRQSVGHHSPRKGMQPSALQRHATRGGVHSDA